MCSVIIVAGHKAIAVEKFRKFQPESDFRRFNGYGMSDRLRYFAPVDPFSYGRSSLLLVDSSKNPSKWPKTPIFHPKIQRFPYFLFTHLSMFTMLVTTIFTNQAVCPDHAGVSQPFTRSFRPFPLDLPIFKNRPFSNPSTKNITFYRKLIFGLLSTVPNFPFSNQEPSGSPCLQDHFPPCTQGAPHSSSHFSTLSRFSVVGIDRSRKTDTLAPDCFRLYRSGSGTPPSVPSQITDFWSRAGPTAPQKIFENFGIFCFRPISTRYPTDFDNLFFRPYTLFCPPPDPGLRFPDFRTLTALPGPRSSTGHHWYDMRNRPITDFSKTDSAKTHPTWRPYFSMILPILTFRPLTTPPPLFHFQFWGGEPKKHVFQPQNRCPPERRQLEKYRFFRNFRSHRPLCILNSKSRGASLDPITIVVKKFFF